MTAYTTLQFTVPAEIKVRLANRAMLTISHGGARLTLSDTWDKPEAVGDLIARMYETLVAAPGLTEDERQKVRDRMMEAQMSVQPAAVREVACGPMQTVEGDEPIPCTLPPPADATSNEDRVICFTKLPGGFCVLDKGHDEGCANVRTVVGT